MRRRAARGQGRPAHAGSAARLRTLSAFHSGRYEVALASSRKLLRLTPDSSSPGSSLVNFALAANRPREALEALGRLDAAESPFPVASPTLLRRLAGAYHVLGRYEDELDPSGSGLACDPDGEVADCEARPLVALGRLEDARGRPPARRPAGFWQASLAFPDDSPEVA